MAVVGLIANGGVHGEKKQLFRRHDKGVAEGKEQVALDGGGNVVES